MEEILQAISDDIGKDIEFYYSDIGVMNRLKSRFDNETIRQWADYFIRYDLAMIATEKGERFIHDKRLSELRRARQSSPGIGAGSEVCERTGISDQPEIWDT